MASFNPMSQYIQIPFDQKSHFTQFRRFEKYFSSYKIKPSPNEIEQLERECDIPQLYYESYKKTEDYDQILKMVETIYNINDSPIDSLSFFKTLIKLPTFLKGVSRDFFLSQNSYNPRTIHELYNFIVMKKYKITSKQFKFYRLIINKFLRDHSDVMNQIPIEKIFSENSELPLQIILDRINQNIPKIDYNLSMQVKPKDQPEPHLNYDNYDAFDLKILSVKKEKLDREISNRMLNESLLREVNQKSPELSDDEEKKESIHKNLNEKKKIDIDIDEDEEEEVKVSYDKNNKNLIDFNQELEEIEKTGLNFKKLDEKTISFDQTSIEKNSIINNNNNSKEISESLFFNDKKRENNKKEEENFQEIKKDFEELSKTSNLSSLYSISDHFYLVDFQIPPKNLIARKIKSIEICYGKVDLYCDNCTFVSSEAIITKSNISGVKKTKKICRMCSKTFEKAKLPELKSIGLSSKNENIQNKISEKNQNNEFSYELKAFFRMSLFIFYKIQINFFF